MLGSGGGGGARKLGKTRSLPWTWFDGVSTARGKMEGGEGEGGRRWWQYSKLKSMAAALGSSPGGLGAHDQLAEFDL